MQPARGEPAPSARARCPRAFGVAFAALHVGLLLAVALPAPVAADTLDPPRCRPQKALDFLKRASFVKKGQLDAKGNERALRYRVEQYGHLDGVPFAESNAINARSRAVGIKFFGLPLSIHRAIAPAVRCVERHLRAHCERGRDVYKPRAVGGFRENNTYRGGEVSNHLFGIAIDIDPNRNPCCGCVDPWPQHPACQAKEADVFERTALPRCWIDGFERYGFYWLGRDPQLRDTMHFEFLGDPELILAR